MTYTVKELFLTLQGEGARAGRRAVFCRFSGCNLWSGLEKDRASANCNFCDTDFVGTDGFGGGKFRSPDVLAETIERVWQEKVNGGGSPYVVFTGGEPALQIDSRLLCDLKTKGFECAIETNGTLELPAEIDWITVSPKSRKNLRVTAGNELKLVFPQVGLLPEEFINLDFDNFFLQPMDSLNYEENLKSTVQYCLVNPKWRLSLQTHKIIGID